MSAVADAWRQERQRSKGAQSLATAEGKPVHHAYPQQRLTYDLAVAADFSSKGFWTVSCADACE